MGTLKGRRLFFGTRSDLAPGLAAIESSTPLIYVLQEMRDDPMVTALPSLAAHETLGRSTTGNTAGDARYFVFPRDRVPAARAVPQRRGGTKYIVDPTPECLIFRPGGLHEESRVLVAGELQEPLDAAGSAKELFQSFARELLNAFVQVGVYWVGPEALSALRGGRRLVTIGIRSPPEYDLDEQ